MLRLVAQGPTISPASFKSFSQKAETVLSFAARPAFGLGQTRSDKRSQLICTSPGSKRVMATLRQMCQAVTGSFSSYTTPMAEWNTSCHRSRRRSWLAHSRSAGQDRAHTLRRFSRAFGKNAGGIYLARASRGEDGSRRVGVDPFAQRK